MVRHQVSLLKWKWYLFTQIPRDTRDIVLFSMPSHKIGSLWSIEQTVACLQPYELCGSLGWTRWRGDQTLMLR